MIKTVMMSAALVLGATSIASATTAMQTGRSASMHRHHRMHMRMHHRVSRGVGENNRQTATGGNPGGYSSRN